MLKGLKLKAKPEIKGTINIFYFLILLSLAASKSFDPDIFYILYSATSKKILGRCAKCIEQNAVICKAHKPIFYSQLNLVNKMCQLENSTFFYPKKINILSLIAVIHLKEAWTRTIKSCKCKHFKLEKRGTFCKSLGWLQQLSTDWI